MGPCVLTQEEKTPPGCSDSRRLGHLGVIFFVAFSEHPGAFVDTQARGEGEVALA